MSRAPSVRDASARTVAVLTSAAATAIAACAGAGGRLGLHRPAPRRTAKLVGLCVLGYTAFWLTASLGVLAVSAWAGERVGAERELTGVRHFQQVDDRLWRGSAPTGAGYRALAAHGIRTVVDLRAEDLGAAELARPGRAGLDVVRMPVRDGQTPDSAQVDRFLRVVAEAEGPVFVHCGAGVGRTGSMTAAYLVRTGQATPGQAALRTVAVGPPSLEQIYYVLSADRDVSRQPPGVVSLVSRLADAPRRIKASL
ncbi:dual specificity protein phosphatase family protein [Streptomyces sp. CC224B]|uniref:fused DSP-PTPase phosphatase/NAD kinase-like protein n=1 Tax=Streptomyces sp. CC224B TaxID=3044571 RepID=UPI0024A83CF9|nr:dual specificity protein phosphatase family protein [Streptomyces sp. CC224B]